MKRFVFLLLCAAMLGLGGCATLDYRDAAILRQHNVSPVVYDKMVHGVPLRLPDVVELSQRQVPPPLILDYLDSTYSVYRLDSGEVLRLRRNGVAPEVVDYLLATPEFDVRRRRDADWAWYGPGWYNQGFYGYGYPYRDRVVVVRDHGGHHRHHWH